MLGKIAGLMMRHYYSDERAECFGKLREIGQYVALMTYDALVLSHVGRSIVDGSAIENPLESILLLGSVPLMHTYKSIDNISKEDRIREVRGYGV